MSASKWCPLVEFQQYVKNIPDDGQTIKLLTSAKLRCCLESSPLFTSYKKKYKQYFIHSKTSHTCMINNYDNAIHQSHTQSLTITHLGNLVFYHSPPPIPAHALCLIHHLPLELCSHLYTLNSKHITLKSTLPTQPWKNLWKWGKLCTEVPRGLHGGSYPQSSIVRPNGEKPSLSQSSLGH